MTRPVVFNLKLKDIYSGPWSALRIYIEDDINHRLFVDPWNVKYRDNQMLRTNEVAAVDVITDLLPHVINVGGVLYRTSNYALDFAFCLPCIFNK